jgi:hypothetical protein
MDQCIKFILFWNDTVHVSDGLSIQHREFKTAQRATGICQTGTAVCLLAGTRWNSSYPLASGQQYLFDISLLVYVQSSTPDDGRKDHPKLVECHSKIK